MLIDPLTQNVHAVDAREAGNGTRQIDALPLADYPLILTDRAVVA